jgi:hypothetical protein
LSNVICLRYGSVAVARATSRAPLRARPLNWQATLRCQDWPSNGRRCCFCGSSGGRSGRADGARCKRWRGFCGSSGSRWGRAGGAR